MESRGERKTWARRDQSVVLVSAFGNPDLILEYLDFFNGGTRFSYNREAARVRDLFSGCTVEDVHLVCTGAVRGTFEDFDRRVRREYGRVRLRPVFLPCDDIDSAASEGEMREAVYACVRELVGSGRRVILLSGGRKTMTNRLIEAGLLYGCEGYLSLTAPREIGEDVRGRTELFNVLWIPARRFYEERRSHDVRKGVGDAFRSLSHLPWTVLNRLQKERIGRSPESADQDLAWLRLLPKADLHCHLGGSFDAGLLRRLARDLIEECGIDREAVLQRVSNVAGCPVAGLTSDRLRALNPDTPHCLGNLGLLLGDIPSADGIPALVDSMSEAQIEELSWDGREPGRCRDMGLAWYMACGDLGGSALLQTETNLRQALFWLLEESRQDGVRYLEVRCSPGNYTRRGLTADRVLDILLDEGSRFMAAHPGFTVNFLVMATRHREVEAVASHVDLAVRAMRAGRKGGGSRVVGFDLAGQEENHDPIRYQHQFAPLHENFVNITIHAGEMAEDDRIWQALYLLHARRIGHGLKLVNNRKMMDYIRDYGTAIEMCPTSNRQTNAFLEPGRDGADGEPYPLAAYLEHGITVTVNTDNPGISATRLSREYLQAARFCPDGLSRWDILKLIRNSFRSVFLPKDEKDRLLKEVDQEIFNILVRQYFPTDS